MIEAKSLGLEEARQIAEAALKAAAETKPPDRPMSIAVVDSSGNLTYFARMDGASPNSVNMAINKAYTAIRWKRDCIDIMNGFVRTGGDMAWFGDPRYAPVPGGVLIKSGDGTIVGAIGTSGRVGETPVNDEELARIGAKAAKV